VGVFIAAICIAVNAARAAVFDTDSFGNHLSISSDSIVLKNANLNYSRIDTSYRIRLQNFGNVNANIFVCPGCDFYFRNAGMFAGTVFLNGSSEIYQEIRGSGDMNPIRSIGGTRVAYVSNKEILSLAKIMGLVQPDRLVLENARIDFDLARAVEIPTELRGTVSLKLPNLPTGQTMLFSNVSGSMDVSVIINDTDGIYQSKLDFVDGTLIATTTRETDYNKIFGGTTGSALAALPADSRLTAKLNRQSSMAGIQRVMNGSIMFNGLNMMRPVSDMHEFEMARGFVHDDYAGVSGGYIFGKNSGMPVVNANAEFGSERFRFTGGAHFGMMQIGDGYERADGKVFGASAACEWDGDYLFANARAIASFGTFNANVMDSGKINDSPNGTAVTGTSEFGANFKYDNMFAAPFVRGKFEYLSVLSQSSTTALPGIGMRFGWTGGMFGIKTVNTHYAVIDRDRVNVGTDFQIKSGEDGIAANVGVAALRMGLAWSFMAHAGVRMVF